jgi:hypothetical protein
VIQHSNFRHRIGDLNMACMYTGTMFVVRVQAFLLTSFYDVRFTYRLTSSHRMAGRQTLDLWWRMRLLRLGQADASTLRELPSPVSKKTVPIIWKLICLLVSSEFRGFWNHSESRSSERFLFISFGELRGVRRLLTTHADRYMTTCLSFVQPIIRWCWLCSTIITQE